MTAGAWMFGAHSLAAILTFAVVVYSARLCSAVAALTQLVVAALLWLTARAPQPVPLRFSRPRGQHIAVSYRSPILGSSLRQRGPPFVSRFA